MSCLCIVYLITCVFQLPYSPLWSSLEFVQQDKAGTTVRIMFFYFSSAFNTTQCVQYHPVCTRMQADPSTTFWIIGLSDRQTTVRVSEQEHPRVPLHTVHLRFLTQLWVLSPTEILRCLCRCRVSLVQRKRSAEDWWTALFHGVEKNHGCGL